MSSPAPDPDLPRCPWCPTGDAPYQAYHDEEWGVPVRDGLTLFSMLNLEGAQAGLSWRTILNKRQRYYEVFEGFDPQRLMNWTPEQIATALQDPGIVRNRLKVNGVVKNSRALQEHFGGDLAAFSTYLWGFVGGKPLQATPPPRAIGDYPVKTAESDAMSKALKKLGFTFVGSAICYAFMQAVGMVNDHSQECFRREAISRMADE